MTYRVMLHTNKKVQQRVLHKLMHKAKLAGTVRSNPCLTNQLKTLSSTGTLSHNDF